MNYYLIIIFLVSTFILLPILNFNLYGYEVSNVNYLNETKHVGFVPIKSKILPQYEEVSDTQSKNQTKPQSDMPANDIHKSNNSDESDESAQQPITQVKSQTEVKANDNNKSNNSEDVIVTVVSSDGSEVKPQKDSEANDNNKSNNSDESDESAQQPITQVKSQTEVKANDNNKSNNSTKSVANASPGIKILSPVSGKEIPAGTLTIFGISSDSEKSNCRVFVDLNNQKPFQEATATGPYGNDDYSSWTFTFSPAYHTIENGLNDLTSKLECEENSKVTTKWHSINVTGVITKDANPTSTLVYDDPQGILPQLKTLSTNPTASTTGIANNETTISTTPIQPPTKLSANIATASTTGIANNETTISTTPIQPPTKLSANVELSKDQIFPGDTQNITVKIFDSKTLQHVAGANIGIKVMQGSTMLNEYKGTADASGTYSYSWISSYDIPSGKYDVLVSASANGHEPVLEIGSFLVQRQLLVEASLLKGLLVPGDKQAIDVKVMDANTKKIVSGANVMAKIGENNEYNGTADASGKYSYSWNIGSDTPTGKYDVLVSSSAKGYEPVSKTGSFLVQRQLLVEASLLKGLLVPGDKQTIDVKVMDANTKEIVSGAAVEGKIGTKKFSSNTDDTGAISYSWDTSPTSGGNSYQIGLDVSSKGYPKVTKTVSFKMDKPQNLLAPPISNQENKVVNVNNEDLNNDLESQIKFQECSNMLSNVGCNTDVSDKPIPNPNTEDKPIPNPNTEDKPIPNPNTEDKPIPNPNTDDKPIPNPNTDDKPIPNPNTDDKPIPDTDNGIENIKSEKNENENNGYDFLASISN